MLALQALQLKLKVRCLYSRLVSCDISFENFTITVGRYNKLLMKNYFIGNSFMKKLNDNCKMHFSEERILSSSYNPNERC